ncbi:MAG: glycosyltransferase family 4 protein, partial [Caulobacterales bacterium]|nr:glycosyltransferase family 4 protein [Caulobacterales bacterium]
MADLAPMPARKALFISLLPLRPARNGYAQRADMIASALDELCDCRVLTLADGRDEEGVAATRARYDARFVTPHGAPAWRRAARQGIALARGRHIWWGKYLSEPGFTKAREEMARFDPDIVIAGHTSLVSIPAALGFDAGRVIVDHHDPMSTNCRERLQAARGLSRLRCRVELAVALAAERQCAGLRDQWVVSEHDRAVVEGLTGAPARVVPNAVDDALFALTPDELE